MSSELPPRTHFQPRRRQLSPFLGQQMLLDFIDGRLDDERRVAVHEVVQKDPALQSQMEALKAAQEYCSKLSAIEIAEHFVGKMRDEKTPWVRARESLSWSRWPTFARWGAEALVISSLISVAALLVPWDKLFTWTPKRAKEVVLTEVHKEPGAPADIQPTPAPALTAQPAPSAPGPIDHFPEPKKKLITLPSATPAPTEFATAVIVAQPPPKDVPLNPTPPSTMPKTAVVVKTPAPGEEAESTSAETKVETQGKGFLYHADMSLTGLDAANEKIVAKIEEMGGKKAGQVELGWKKPKGRYSHFSLPESNYETLVQFLRTFGPVQIKKEPHWRVMPEGEIRIILWIEDGDAPN